MRAAVDSLPTRKIGPIPMTKQNANCPMYLARLVRSFGFSQPNGLSPDRVAM